MGSFNSTTKTEATQNQSQTGTNTPTEAGNVTDFRNSLYPQINSLIANANKPVYGAPQQAEFTNNLNKNTNANFNTLASQMAQRTGSVNSGAFSGGIQNMLAQRSGAQANYAAMVPGANRAAQQQGLTSALGLGTNFAGRAPVGNVSSGTGQSNSTQSTSSTPSVFSDILGVASAAMGAYTGMSGMGGGGGGGTPSYMSALAGPNPSSFGAGPGGYSPTPGFTSDAAGYVSGFGGY